MKKVIFSILSLCFISLSSFSQNTSYLDDYKLMEFTNKLLNLPFSERDVILKACDTLEKDFVNDPDNADWAFQLLFFYHELSCIDKNTTLHKTFSDEEIRAFVFKDIPVSQRLRNDIKKFETEYAKYGYRINSFEDTSKFIEVNPHFLFKKLSKLLSVEYAYYFGNFIGEFDYPTYWNAELLTSLSVVQNRIAWRDEFLFKNPEFIRNDLVKKELEDLCFVLARGLEKSPIYDQNDIILPEYKNAIQTYYKTFPDTYYGKFFVEFIHRLALNKYRNNDAIDQFVLNTLCPVGRKNIDPLLKYKDILIENLID